MELRYTDSTVKALTSEGYLELFRLGHNRDNTGVRRHDSHIDMFGCLPVGGLAEEEQDGMMDATLEVAAALAHSSQQLVRVQLGPFQDYRGHQDLQATFLDVRVEPNGSYQGSADHASIGYRLAEDLEFEVLRND